ncbi:MAG: beta-N-acetylhexosaminidase [Burkholderiaceae bacterium]
MTAVNMPLGAVVVDVAGLVLTDAERSRLAHPDVGGVILFARNFESRAQLAALCAEIHALRTPRLPISVDHEGGRVQRFRTDGFTRLPAMRKLGELWMQDAMAATRTASQIGYVLAAELRACGVDLSFTPVLDLDYGGSSVIGDRAFHSDARVTALLAKSLMHGLLEAGMTSCGKHFPGHGFVAADSHHEVPVDERSFKQIMAADAMPYDWLSETLGAVMPAHVIYPKVDPQPAGFSRKWLQEVLRKQMGFDGVIFSDDLSMEGASVAGDIHARASAALTAGCDQVLVCNAPDVADELLARGVTKPSAVSQNRIGRLIKDAAPLSWNVLQSDPRYRIAVAAISKLQ